MLMSSHAFTVTDVRGSIKIYKLALKYNLDKIHHEP